MADPIVNFFQSTLVGTYSNTDTSFTIATGDGALLPDPSTDGEFNLVVFEGTAGVSASAFEIVRVTAKSGDVLTVTREQENTTALTIGATTHSIILSATKKTFDDKANAVGASLTGVETITFTTDGDGVLELPKGTFAQRPAVPSAGMIRWNTSTSSMEIYDGSAWQKLTVSAYVGAWTTTSSLNVARSQLYGVGTVNDSLSFGGYTSASVSTTEKWSTTSWATTSSMNVARQALGGSGTASNSLSISGATGGGTPVSTTEKWSTSSWATTSSVNQAKGAFGSCGTVNDTLSFAGYTSISFVSVGTCEKWSTSSWATTSSVNVARQAGTGMGDHLDALLVVGYTNTNVATTEKWATSSWATTSSANQAKRSLSGSGTINDAIIFGGFDGSVRLSSTERWNGSSWSTTSSLNAIVNGNAGSGNGVDALSFGGTTGANTTATEKWGLS